MTDLFLDAVTKRYGRTLALDDVSLEIGAGEFLVLLGPSGCGKSTLLRIIAGLIAPSGGRVIADGRDITALAPQDRDIAMVFQSYALYPHLTVRRNLGFGLRVRGHPKQEIERAVSEVAAQLQLSTVLDRRPRELSGGQRQRVALGRAIVRSPSVFLMDEPLSSLDAQLRTATRLELSQLHQRLATTFVYVTHDQIEAMTMATRIAVINAGRIEQVGTPAEIYDHPASTFVASFVGTPPMNLIAASAHGEHGRVRVYAPGVEGVLRSGSLVEQPVLIGVRPERLELEPIGPPEHGDPAVRLTGRVIAVENLGSEEVALCELDGATIAARGPRPLGLTPGQGVTLRAEPRDVALFDPTSGRRLAWSAAEEARHTHSATAVSAAGAGER